MLERSVGAVSPSFCELLTRFMVQQIYALLLALYLLFRDNICIGDKDQLERRGMLERIQDAFLLHTNVLACDISETVFHLHAGWAS